MSEKHRFHPQPDCVHTRFGVQLQWPNMPYYVEIDTHSTAYIKVVAQDGYRKLLVGQRGYIYETSNPEKLARLTERCLRIAWKLNHSPKHDTNIKGMVHEVLNASGICDDLGECVDSGR